MNHSEPNKTYPNCSWKSNLQWPFPANTYFQKYAHKNNQKKSTSNMYPCANAVPTHPNTKGYKIRHSIGQGVHLCMYACLMYVSHCVSAWVSASCRLVGNHQKQHQQNNNDNHKYTIKKHTIRITLTITTIQLPQTHLQQQELQQ